MTDPYLQWAAQFPEAARALRAITLPPPPPPGQGSESRVQSAIRLEAARRGIRLHRNNVGVLKDQRGVPVRFGLMNDSHAQNQVFKSSDLIGWRPVLITPEMVGTTIARFVSVECKKPDWKWSGNAHEKAQQNWLNLVVQDGGEGYFSTGQVLP